jgi:hypothetical protein
VPASGDDDHYGAEEHDDCAACIYIHDGGTVYDDHTCHDNYPARTSP